MGFITIPHTFDVDTTVRSFFNDSLEAGSIGVSTENVFLGRVTNIATDTITVRTIGNERLRIVDGDTIFSTNGGSTTTVDGDLTCLLYTSPSPRDRTRSRMPSSA